MKKQCNQYLIILMTMMTVSFVITSSCTSSGAKPTAQERVVSPAVPIHTAAYLGDLKSIEQHIRAGSDLNAKDEYGSTPLMIAITFNKTDVALALINAGADLTVVNNEGATPLHTAAFLCRPEIVKALLEHGADKTATDKYGSTPLASVSTPFEMVKPIYDQLSKSLGSLGFRLDYKYLEAERPKIAAMLETN